jgi:hypothetical protein
MRSLGFPTSFLASRQRRFADALLNPPGGRLSDTSSKDRLLNSKEAVGEISEFHPAADQPVFIGYTPPPNAADILARK